MRENDEDGIWSGGYVSDVVYTLGFHRELAPSFLNYVCLINAVEGLPAGGRRLRYCELGCGRGYDCILLAAANPEANVVGIDFNPTHIAEAQALADRAGIANVRFLHMDFGDSARTDDPILGSFDIVALHGVYSWVPTEARAEIHEFLKSRLVPRGIAYVSYNALPGWTEIIPMQKLLMETAKRLTGDSIARFGEALRLLKVLIDNSGGMVSRHSALTSERLSTLAKSDINYLVHEYLHPEWEPLFASDAIGALAKIGLSYVGSGSIAHNRIELCVPKDLRQTVRTAPDLAMRELLKDYVVGRKFRQDVYVREPRNLTSEVQRQRLMSLLFAPTPAAIKQPDALQTPVGMLKPRRKQTLEAIWRQLEAGVASGADLVGAAEGTEGNDEHAWALVEALVHNGLIHPVPASLAAIDGSASRRLNDVVMELSLAGDSHQFLASPIIGSAIFANRPQRVVAQLLSKETSADDLTIASRALDVAVRTPDPSSQEARAIEKTPATTRSMAAYVRDFRERQLPRWRMLGVV